MKLPSATCDAPTATVAKLRSRLGGFGMALLTQLDIARRRIDDAQRQARLIP